MNEIEQKEKVRKFLHDLSNKILPLKLKIDIMREDQPTDGLEFIDKKVDEVIDFIKSFDLEKFETSDSKNKNFMIFAKNKIEKNENLNSKQLKILLVDDNPEILLNMGSILKRKGYLVSSCDNGKNAFELISGSPAKFNVMITDELMPGMSGTDLIQSVLKTAPDMKIICWSGYFDKDNYDSENLKYLQKPVSKDKLLTILEEFGR